MLQPRDALDEPDCIDAAETVMQSQTPEVEIEDTPFRTPSPPNNQEGLETYEKMVS